MIILGLDPGLGTTGWGLIRAEGNRLSHLANGRLKTDSAAPLPRRLAHLDAMLGALIVDHAPDAAAVEERSEEHTSELQSTNAHLVCRLLLEKTKPHIHRRRAPHIESR